MASKVCSELGIHRDVGSIWISRKLLKTVPNRPTSTVLKPVRRRFLVGEGARFLRTLIVLHCTYLKCWLKIYFIFVLTAFLNVMSFVNEWFSNCLWNMEMQLHKLFRMKFVQAREIHLSWLKKVVELENFCSMTNPLI